MTAALSLARTSGGGLWSILGRQVGTEGLNRVFGGQVTIQVATLRATHGEKYPYSEPYPYWKKRYGLIGATFDNGTHRMNENSKVTDQHNSLMSVFTDLNYGVSTKSFFILSV